MEEAEDGTHENWSCWPCGHGPLNIAKKGFPISVYNRTTSKVDDEAVQRAKAEGNLPVYGYHACEGWCTSQPYHCNTCSSLGAGRLYYLWRK